MLVLFQLIAMYQKSKITLHYNKLNKPNREFIENSNIKNMAFRPWIFAITPFIQCLIYLIWESLAKIFGKWNFDREIIIAEDGGTMGIDWYVDQDGVGRPHFKEGEKPKPILILVPGLNGGSYCMYTHALAKVAQLRGFKCGTMLFRCTPTLPITSVKLTCSTSWEDIDEVVDYVNNKYVIDPLTKEKRVRFYGYGTSLGAQLLGLYLCHTKRRCPFDAASLFSPPYDIIQGWHKFYNGSFPYYAYLIGQFLS